MTTDFSQLALQIGATLRDHQLVMATAESCTGGGISYVVTSIAGSSAWFDRAFVTYSNEAKMEMLGVQAATLDQYGAVSEQTAAEMVAGAVEHSRAQVAVSVTGIAGPDGGSAEKPVGMVCFGWSVRGHTTTTTRVFTGDRAAVRNATIALALEELGALVSRS